MQEYNKSELCSGYNLGVGCMACCIWHPLCRNTGINEASELMSARIRIRNVDGRKIIEYKEPNFQKCSERFYEIISRNAEMFEGKLKNKKSLKEISEGSGFLGKINRRVGCLLYQFECPENGIFYRSEGCAKYLCSFAKKAKKNYYGEVFDDTMKKFIKENLENKRLNDLSYSRLVEIVRFFEWDLRQVGFEFDFRKENSEKALGELGRLLGIVSR